MKPKMTKKEKIIAADTCPTYGGAATKEEVKIAKKKAIGHYWYDAGFEEYIAYSPTRRRAYFMHELNSWAPWNRKKKWKSLAKQCAKLWAQGKYKECREVEKYLWSLR